MGCMSSKSIERNVSGRPPSSASEKQRTLLRTNTFIMDEELLKQSQKHDSVERRSAKAKTGPPQGSPPAAPGSEADPNEEADEALLMPSDPDYDLGNFIDYAPSMSRTAVLRLEASTAAENGHDTSKSKLADDNPAGAAAASGLRLQWAYRTIAGRSAFPPSKPNQDSVVAFRLENRPDVAVFGVFDGHGPFGEHASHFCRMELHRIMLRIYSDLGPTAAPQDVLDEAIRALHEDFITQDPSHTGVDPHVSGTTLVVALIVEDTVWVANVGDSRCVLGEQTAGESRGRLKEMSDDHKPERTSERERIERTDAVLMTEGQLRGGNPSQGKTYICRRMHGEVVYGVLFTRSIGDADAHEHLGVSAEPEFKRAVLAADDEEQEVHRYLVLASDGVWDMMSNEQVMSKVFQCKDPLAASEVVAGTAKDLWDNDRMHSRRDDITVCVVKLS